MLTDWSRWPNFTEREMACRHCGKCDMDPDFMDMVQKLRSLVRRPIRVSSGYRCPEHNNAVSTTGYGGPHTTGKAIDIAVSGAAISHELLGYIYKCGFLGIGVNLKGSARFIHIDMARDRPALWSY